MLRYRSNLPLCALLVLALTAAQPTHVWGQGIRPPGKATAAEKEAATRLLKQARQAMSQGRLDDAERFLREAEGLHIKFDSLLRPLSDSPARVRKDLERLREAQGGERPKATSVELPGVRQPGATDTTTPTPRPITAPTGRPAGTTWVEAGPANGLADVVDNPHAGASHQAQGDNSATEDAKQQSMNLLAQARSALDRQDVEEAKQLVQQASRLGVPASAYAPGETQPWMLQLQIHQAAKRRSGVVTASVSDDASPEFPVKKGVYDPASDGSQVVPASSNVEESTDIRELSETAPGVITPPADLPLPERAEPDGNAARNPVSATTSRGMRLYDEGSRAVEQGDLNRARELFRQAWSYEEEFDPETRQRLQDHLQLLRVVTPQETTHEATQKAIESPERKLVQSLYQEITREQIAAEQQRTREPKAVWERLKALRERLASAEIDGNTKEQLLRRVDRTIDATQQYIDANQSVIAMDEQNAAVLRDVEHRRRAKVEREEQLAKLVQEFDGLLDQQRYPEAVVVSKKARELDPQNPVVQNMLWKGHFAQRMSVEWAMQERGRTGFDGQLDSVREASIPFDDRKPYTFPDKPEWEDLTKRRMEANKRRERPVSEADRKVYEALKKPVHVDYTNKPLSEVLSSLAKLADIDIILDQQGLAAEGITSDTLVTLSLSKPIALRSALNHLLPPLRLTHLVQDEVLRVTSEQNKALELRSETYPVADLVIPIPNFAPTYYMGLPSALREGYRMAPIPIATGGAHRALLSDAQPYSSPLNPSALAQVAGPSMDPAANSGMQQPMAMGPGGIGGGAQADFDSLIDLIVNTVAPDSWEDSGIGTGRIEQYESNLSLVVRTTEDVHAEVADLLEQLRRLQDLQVTIEVRFITLNDNFFERIGVDFDFNIDDNVTSLPAEDDGPAVTVGIDNAGNLTNNLDMRFTQGSFASAIPAFGQFDPNSAANFGFAVLSDIEAFFVIQAAQGDSRTNVLQAPKVTLFNGQSASIQDQAQRPFVVSVVPVVGDFAVAQQPIIAVLAEGTALNVQAVVSQDRRFVRLTLNPFFSTIDDVEEFTFEGRRRSNSGTTAVDPTDPDETVNDDEEEEIEGTTVQLPTLAFTTVNTTVSVPDGGTILLGGVKRLREGRSESGVPFLNKIPFVNRLFNNVGIGREASSLMMMVTPRIIIQEEEEEALGTAGI